MASRKIHGTEFIRKDDKVTPQDFCYWLQGYAEVARSRPSEDQWQCILDHLKLVFEKVTPPMPEEKFKEIVDDLKKRTPPPLSMGKKYCLEHRTVAAEPQHLFIC